MSKFTLVTAFNTMDSYFKTEECKTCNYNNIGICLCDTCTNARFPDKKAENYHSDVYFSVDYENLLREEKEEYEYDWFGLVRRRKL